MAEADVVDVNAEAKEVNSDSTTEEILAAAPQEEAQTEEESSASEEASNTTGEVEKTPSAEEVVKLEEEQEKALIEAGKPIPYERFKSVISKRNELQKGISDLQSKIDQVAPLFRDPDIMRAIMKKRGYQDEAVDTYLKNQGIAVEKQPVDTKSQLKELVKDLDLSTVDGWLEAQARIADFRAEHKSKEALTAYDHQRLTEKEAADFITTGESEAKNMAEKIYKIPYGEAGKDENNPTTAVGKISAYLENNPEDAYLGHVKLLRLAMSEEGFKLGEEKGVKKEKDRIAKVKAAAMESEETVMADERPDKNWSTQKILDWREKHPNVTL